MKKHKFKDIIKELFTLKWLTSHKILLAIIISIIYMLLVVCIPCFFLYKNSNHTLEFSYYFSQLLSGLFVVLGTALALLQYSNDCNDKKNDRDDRKRMEAAKLALSFADEAIPMINQLVRVYKCTPQYVDDIIKGLFNKDLQDFNLAEIQRIFPLYKEIEIKLCINYYLESHPEVNDLNDPEVRKAIYDTVKEVNALCTTIANKFEYYSICFNAEIVDNDTLYQSLHDCFLSTVHMLYIFAFKGNVNEYDRLFYNTSELYNRWKATYQEKKGLELEKIKAAEEAYKATFAHSKKDIIVSPNIMQ